MKKTNELRKALIDLERQKEEVKARLTRIEKDCPHEWKVRKTPIRFEGYRTQGDPPGTMGVDWRGPMYVPPRIHPQWTRTCRMCGKVETTSETEQKQVPATLEDGSRTTTEVAVPKFC